MVAHCCCMLCVKVMPQLFEPCTSTLYTCMLCLKVMPQLFEPYILHICRLCLKVIRTLLKGAIEGKWPSDGGEQIKVFVASRHCSVSATIHWAPSLFKRDSQAVQAGCRHCG